MFSLHQHKKQESRQMQSVKKFERKSKSLKAYKDKTAALSESSHIRIQNFSRDAPSDFQQIMKTGAVPLINPSKHVFRPKSLCPNIYVRNYVQQSQKIAQHVEDFKSSHLDPEKYFKLSEDWLRKDTSGSSQLLKRPQFEDSSTRIQRISSENNCYRLEPSDGYLLKNPTYRKIVKNRWMNKKDFLRFTRHVKKEDSCWKVTEPLNGEPYIDFSKITDSMLRSRDKCKESRQDFQSTFAKDSWNKLFPRPVSNSTYISEIKAQSFIKSSKIYPNSIESSNANTLFN